MRKIKTLFKRNFEDQRHITEEYNEGTEWVRNGEGVATRKIDGTSVLISKGVMFKRLEVKPGKQAPENFALADFDEVTGKKVGWIPVTDANEDKWHREAISGAITEFAFYEGMQLPIMDGTYELVGPKIQGNPEGYEKHMLVSHNSTDHYTDVPTEFEALRTWLEERDIEGLVWHHPDGRMVKIRKKDFGLKRK